MSDPVSKVEIEDVLSSIRRLVSEEKRVEPRRVLSRERAGTDRLVLTPALRVATREEPAPPVSEEGMDGHDRAAEDSAESTDAALEESVADHVADDTSWQADSGPEGAADAPWQDPNATLFSAARAAGEPEDAWEEAVPDTDEEVSGDQPADNAVAEDDTPERDGSEAGDRFEDEACWEEPEPVFHSERATPVSDEVAEVAEESDEADPGFDARAESLSAKIEALEAAIGQTRDQWEPDGAGGDDYAGTPVETIEWEDHAENVAVETPPLAEPETELDGADLLADDETILDEESLRELVADIVREELQGALGERITRNVRKLVRREIHRALAAQDLE